jgi:hypothetical protein
MCVIAVYTDNYPKLADLELMESFNKDGAGMAWIDNKSNKVEWVKGLKLSAKDIHDIISKRKINLPFVIHFRISSVGKTNDELCHPFTIETNDNNELKGTTEKGVLFHNGTNTNWSEELWQFCLARNVKIPEGELSDTRAMAYMISYLGNGYIENFAPDYDKYVVLTPKGLRTFGFFSHDDGKNYVSNTYHNRVAITEDLFDNNKTSLYKSQTKKKKTKIVKETEETYDSECCQLCLDNDEVIPRYECNEHWWYNDSQRNGRYLDNY